MTAPAHKELGQSKDPVELVPGNAEHVHHDAGIFQAEATKCDSIATSLKGVRTPHWTGPAADGFEATMGYEPKLWSTLSDQFDKSAKALEGHGSAIASAQSKARDAIAKWDEGELATKTAVATYNKQVDAYNSSLCVPSPAGIPSIGPARPGPFVDPGQSLRDEAERILDAARKSVESSAGTTMAALGAMPGAKTSGSTSGPSASGSAEGPKFSWKLGENKYGTQPEHGSHALPEAGPFSLSLGKIKGDAHVWGAKGSAEDYWGPVKVHANGDFSVLGADGDASAKLDKNGLDLGAHGEAYLAKAHGEAGGKWGYAEGKVTGNAMAGVDANGDVVVTPTSAHAGGEAFAGAKADVGAEGDFAGVGGEGKAEGWAGAGIAGDVDLGYDGGKLHVAGSGGVALGLGGKLSGGITVDVPEVVHSIGDAADFVGGLFQ